tara:strand:- start:140847 stop:142064 length:1218 start_codon:yes stop_codon:yes gene_type:complete
MENPRKIAIIGGGAAGFFAAMSAKKHHPEAHVIIFEKGSKVLGKVKVSGGGRCNVTHNQTNIKELAKNYPRGEKFLRKAFSQFSVTDTISWFEKRGVKLKIESDNRMFPQSNSSQTIIDTFLKEVQTLGVEVRKGVAFNDLVAAENGLRINLSSGEMLSFDAVIIALGGQKSLEKYEAFSQLGHKILTPVPSLFTFNIADSKIMELMGTVASSVIIKIQGTKLQNQGPLLITHWGMSGPAVLKLSSLAARELAERNYEFTVQINWLGEAKEDDVRNQLAQFIKENGKKQVNKKAFDLPNKLWHFFISELGLEAELTWNTLDKKSKNRLINKILNDTYTIHKKTTFKEEFVICGGVSLADLNVKTMESKIVPRLYFAGEFMDIDGVTGGFNFQAAWTTGFIAGKLG